MYLDVYSQGRHGSQVLSYEAVLVKVPSDISGFADFSLSAFWVSGSDRASGKQLWRGREMAMNTLAELAKCRVSATFSTIARTGSI